MAARNFRAFKLLTLAAAIVATAALAMALCDWTFEVHGPFSIPNVMGSNRVIRYGFSRIHSRSFVDSRSGNGDIVSGRCFADIQARDGIARIHGWRLVRKASPDGSIVFVEID